MNETQKAVIAAAALALAAMCLYPPWHQDSPTIKSGYAPHAPVRFQRDYGFVFSPPPDVSGVDLPRLGLQVAVLAAVCGAAFAWFGDDRLRGRPGG